jgi:hypothetical protein
MAIPDPKPCNRYAKTMPLNAEFIAHLQACDACMFVVAYLNRESETKLNSKQNRLSDEVLQTVNP